MTTEGLSAEDRLRQRDYLLAITRAMTARLDLPAVLARVIESAVEMTHGQSGTIAMRQADGGLRVVASYGLVPQIQLAAPAEGAALARLPDEPAAGSALLPPGTLALLSGEPAALPAVGSALTEGDLQLTRRASVPLLGGVPDERLRHMLALPLRVADEEIGLILVVRSAGAAVFTPLDNELLDAFADQAAVAIHNARLHEQLAARERELAAIVEHDPAGVLLLDARGLVRASNPALRALAGQAEGTLDGRSWAELLALADESGRVQAPALPPAGEVSVSRGWLQRGDGRPGAFVQVTLTPVRSLFGGADGHVADVVDLSSYKAAEDAKRVFLAGLSHELKTPLALIRGYAETLQLPDARADAALFTDAVDVILAETEHLTAMVDQLLTAARLEAGGLALQFDALDLRHMLTRLVDEFALTRPDHDWLTQLPDELPTLTADPLRLREVFLNLLDNAAKYSEAGTRITVSTALSAGAVSVTIADQGVGVAAADQARIFERFARVSDRAEGAGLGLYMARAIVEAHGGRVDVDSAPGAGSRFTVSLPLAPPSAAAADAGSAG